MVVNQLLNTHGRKQTADAYTFLHTNHLYVHCCTQTTVMYTVPFTNLLFMIGCVYSAGETTFHLNEAQAIRNNIVRLYENIDALRYANSKECFI